MIPASTLYDVVDGGRDYRYRFFGSDRVKSHGEDYTNRHVSDITPHLMALKIAAENAKILKTKEPIGINTIAAVGGEEFQYSLMRLHCLMMRAASRAFMDCRLMAPARNCLNANGVTGLAATAKIIRFKLRFACFEIAQQKSVKWPQE